MIKMREREREREREGEGGRDVINSKSLVYEVRHCDQIYVEHGSVCYQFTVSKVMVTLDMYMYTHVYMCNSSVSCLNI